MSTYNKLSFVYPLLIVTAVGFAAAACSRKEVGPPESRLGGAYTDKYRTDDRGGPGRMPTQPGTAEEFRTNSADIVYFPSDSDEFTPEAQQTLTSQARWLKQYAQYAVTIEGHADERGTREYNIALGQRRAAAVQRFLVA